MSRGNPKGVRRGGTLTTRLGEAAKQSCHTIRGFCCAALARWTIGLLLVLFLICSTARTVLAEEVNVIVHPATAETVVSVNTLRAIFGMRLRSWPDGTPITVFVLGDRSPHHDAFSKIFLNVFPHQLRQAWDRLVFSGTGQAPVTIGTELQMRARVASTPGGIGYLPREMVDESVHVLNVQ